MKVAVLGAAGGIGQALSLLLKLNLPAGTDLALYDLAPVTPGVAVDLSHIPTAVKITGFGKEDLDKALIGADIVMIPAGMPRKPGMDRSDLFNINAGVVKTLAEAIVVNCPKALVGVITNPVNTTVAIAAEVFKKAGTYDPKRLFGVTTLDVIRAETFVAELKDKNPKNVAAAIGVNPYFLKEYDLAIKNYPMRKVSQIVGALRDIDVKSKGVGANALPQSDLLKEMLYKIFN